MSKQHVLNWIDGRWVDAERKLESINPATYEVIGTYADGDAATAESGIVAAARAFRTSTWARDRLLRYKVLNQLADAFERHTGDLVEILATENGKIKPEAKFEVDMVPSKLRYYASVARTDYGRAVESRPGSLSIVLRQPVGVAGIVVPWNSPVVLLIRSLAPALAAGCTTVVKMPGQTAQTNFVIAKIIAKAADLPTGVINFFTGQGISGSDHLMSSANVPVISFTGSSKTGRAISATGAKRLKRFGLELGGKNPILIFDDADLEAAAKKASQALTVFAGQFCMTGSRILVQRGAADAFRKKIAALLGNVRVGPAADSASEMGPMIDKPNVERVNKAVKEAISQGAKVVLRGGPVTEGPLARGAFYRPTVLEVTDPTLRIVQEETFGPVLTIQVFDTEEEAVRLANITDYGLATSIWTRDLDRSFRVAREIDAGTIWFNDWAVIYDECEEGGFKQSGLGRMNGLAAIDDFIEYKHLTFSPGRMPV